MLNSLFTNLHFTGASQIASTSACPGASVNDRDAMRANPDALAARCAP